MLAAGTHTVFYTAVDNAGNIAEVKITSITVSAANYPAEISPSSGPIGVPFTITGTGFGAYSAGITVALIGGTTAPLTLWSTTTIKGTVPGGLAPGEYPVLVKRGTTTIVNVEPFTVTVPVLDTITPSSGAIGIPFTLTGAWFGNYAANYTKVLIGGATAPLTLWTDTKIQGTVPQRHHHDHPATSQPHPHLRDAWFHASFRVIAGVSRWPRRSGPRPWARVKESAGRRAAPWESGV